MAGKETKISALKANHGDCIIIETYDLNGAKFNILIDGGTYKTFKFYLNEKVKKLQVIHLLVLTHIDDDHIAGLIEFFKSSLFSETRIDRFWVNGSNLLRIDKSSTKISYAQGIELEKLLISKGTDPGKINTSICEGMNVSFGEGLHIQILTPSIEILNKLYKAWPIKELAPRNAPSNIPVSIRALSQIPRGKLSYLANLSFKPSKNINSDIFNASSISFILTTPTSRLLLLADSRSELVESSLRKLGYCDSNKLEVDLVKVSHHGSINNTSSDLLNIIKCSSFLISTDGGKGGSRHPDRETIARIVCNPYRDPNVKVILYFNYPLLQIEEKAGKIFTEEELVEENFNFYDDIDFLLF